MPPRRRPPIACPPTARRALARLALLAAAAGAASCACAVDVGRDGSPGLIEDHAITIGRRTLRLPPGRWFLLARPAFQASSFRGSVDAYGAWALLAEAGTLRGLVHLELPLHDAPRLQAWAPDACTANPASLHLSDQSFLGRVDCLALQAMPDFPAFLEDRTPGLSTALADRRIPAPKLAVRFAYTHRTDGSFGRLEVYLPTAQFESEDDATRWGDALRGAVAPLFAGNGGEATLPALGAQASPEPPAPAAAPAPPVPLSPALAAVLASPPPDDAWTACLRDTATRIDDPGTPADEVATALTLLCRDVEARAAIAILVGADPLRTAAMSDAERAEAVAAIRRRHAEDGIARKAVLALRAPPGPAVAASAP